MLAFTIMKTLTTYIERCYTVKYEYLKGGKGQRDKFGQAIEPDDPGEINILSVLGPDGIEIKLNPEERASITAEIENDIEDDAEGEDDNSY